jgi:hypothetical protein
MPLGKKGAAARLQGDAEHREQRPTPWLPTAKSIGKKNAAGRERAELLFEEEDRDKEVATREK